MTISIYYYFVLFVLFISYINVKLSAGVLIFGVAFILSQLLPTGFDYQYYETDYLSGYFFELPPFFYTDGGLTAEPLYKIYSGLIRVLTQSSFQFFLSFNFLLCVLVYYVFFPFRRGDIFYFSLLYLTPVILPTIFYFSPRSSLSFFLVLASLYLLISSQLSKAVLCSFLGVMIHSQYIPFVFFLFFVYFLCGKGAEFNMRKSALTLIIVGGVFTISLFFLGSFISLISSALSFLPSGDVASTKLHYFTSSESGFRITSLLSIILFPILMYIYWKRRRLLVNKLNISRDFNERLCFFIMIPVVYGVSINIAFYDAPHLSGRLGRFSDYFLFFTLIPLSLRCVFSNRVVLLVLTIFVVSAPILYPTVYLIHKGLG